MTIATLLQFLLGRKEAIEAFTKSPHTLWIGALFVLSAGFAREYDGVDLLAEPWHLAIPLGASFLAATLMFTVLSESPAGGLGWRQGWRSYRAFLGLFWLTAPLAWLYAIPYEQFLSPTVAARANLLTLAVVAAWRVALIIQIVRQMTNLSLQQLLARVFLAIATMVFFGAIASMIVQRSLMDVMGGVRENNPWEVYPSPGTEFQAGFLALLLTVPLAAVGILSDKPERFWRLNTETTGPHASSGLWGVVALSLAVWPVILPFTQQAQQRRTAVDQAIAREEYAQAAAFLREWPRESFPITWQPGPPKVNRLTALPALVTILQMRKQDLPTWAADYYRERQWLLIREKSIYPYASEQQIHTFVNDPEIKAWLDAPVEPTASFAERGNHERYRGLREFLRQPQPAP